MGKIFAILGDIHSNIDALEVVLADAREQGATDYLCTGDIVGYNAAPHECLQRLAELDCPAVMGNHDFYVSQMISLEEFNEAAAFVVQWTRSKLSHGELEYLKTLPFSRTQLGFSVVHSTWDRPEQFGYVFDNFQAEANFLHQKTPICFHGHTHCPIIYERSMNGVCHVDAADVQLAPGKKYFINVGSVGQPRDLDPRASYVLFDQAAKTVRFRRLEYDIERAQARVREAGLPERLAARLATGQ